MVEIERPPPRPSPQGGGGRKDDFQRGMALWQIEGRLGPGQRLDDDKWRGRS
jgi:hypothetical protein